MTKRKGIFDIQINQDYIPKVNKVGVKRDGIKIESALTTVLRQLEVSGARERTIFDYGTIVNYFIRDSKITFLEDITDKVIYEWLGNMEVSNVTKLTRLKCLKAFLSRCFDNGWFTHKFWRTITVKVDQEIKEGATDEDINLLLSVLDYTKYLDIRNACAVLLMYKCGLRIGTVARMEESHVDLENLRLVLDGKLIKNRKGLILPIDKQMAYLLNILMQQNELIRDEYKQFNNYLFITVKGTPTTNSITSNSIQRQLRKYKDEFGIKNINPHALRRGFAKNLYNKSNNLLLVSKALGHADLSVTTKYLHTDLEKVADELKDYL